MVAFYFIAVYYSMERINQNFFNQSNSIAYLCSPCCSEYSCTCVIKCYIYEIKLLKIIWYMGRVTEG